MFETTSPSSSGRRRLAGVALGTTLAAALAPPCSAAPPPSIPEALQQEAMTCVSEAAEVCPEIWTAQDHGLACMTGKRQAFSPRCRVIYDKVAKALHVTPPRAANPHEP